tara:strand:+ start:11734 stop:13296 length:1563 start_codon:yes stop_codon:yes gene_type:complete
MDTNINHWNPGDPRDGRNDAKYYANSSKRKQKREEKERANDAKHQQAADKKRIMEEQQRLKREAEARLQREKKQSEKALKEVKEEAEKRETALKQIRKDDIKAEKDKCKKKIDKLKKRINEQSTEAERLTKQLEDAKNVQGVTIGVNDILQKELDAVNAEKEKTETKLEEVIKEAQALTETNGKLTKANQELKKELQQITEEVDGDDDVDDDDFKDAPTSNELEFNKSPQASMDDLHPFVMKPAPPQLHMQKLHMQTSMEKVELAEPAMETLADDVHVQAVQPMKCGKAMKVEPVACKSHETEHAHADMSPEEIEKALDSDPEYQDLDQKMYNRCSQLAAQENESRTKWDRYEYEGAPKPYKLKKPDFYARQKRACMEEREELKQKFIKKYKTSKYPIRGKGPYFGKSQMKCKTHDAPHEPAGDILNDVIQAGKDIFGGEKKKKTKKAIEAVKKAIKETTKLQCDSCGELHDGIHDCEVQALVKMLDGYDSEGTALEKPRCPTMGIASRKMHEMNINDVL